MNTSEASISASIAETAADWIVRRDGGALSAEEQQALQEWLCDPIHRDAFERLETLWGLLDNAPVPACAPSKPGAKPVPVPALPAGRRYGFRHGHAAPRQPDTRLRRWSGIAVAASLALLALGTIDDWMIGLRADYVTGVGERRTLTLEDGSQVVLGSSSAIAHDFSGRRRKVRLLEGSALFQVAADADRPFTVEAAGGSATALGTAFAVRTQKDYAELVVTEHRVQVIGGGRSHVVGEGRRVDFGANLLGAVGPAGKDATAWARGRLIVVNRPLKEVIGEIADYHRGYLAVAGSAAEIRVSGVYDLDHPLAAIDSIERSLGLRSFRLSDRMIVLH